MNNGALQDRLMDGGNVCKGLEDVVGSVRGFCKPASRCYSLRHTSGSLLLDLSRPTNDSVCVAVLESVFAHLMTHVQCSVL